MVDTVISVKDLLFTLLLKVGVAASFGALLARWNTFRRVLFTEERDPDQKLKLMLFMTPPLLVGVGLRVLGQPDRFADLSALEGAFLMGLLGGRVVGPIGGAIITIPALMYHEWLGMPRGGGGRAARRTDSPGDSGQRRALEFRTVFVFESAASARAAGAARGDVLGISAACSVCRAGTWARGAGGGDEA